MNQWRRKGPEEVGMGIKWRGAGVGEGVQEAGWEYARLDASECLVLFDLFFLQLLLPSSLVSQATMGQRGRPNIPWHGVGVADSHEKSGSNT